MILHLKIIGLLLVILACIHAIFPRYFDWKNNLAPLSLINRQMMYVHTFFVAFVVFLMGVLCWTSPEDLVQTALGKKICFGFGVFWFARLVIQFFGYSKELWRGRTFETVIHVVFGVLWAYLSLVFFGVSY